MTTSGLEELDLERNFTFCIHGHFYQPPREDPKTGEIPQEPGATPFPNWNERINAHCYLPNSKLGNFEYISFNIGPTLKHWLVSHDPGTMARIVEQDRSNIKNYGVGNAMAQSYNHTILPLAKRTDKETQIRWGIEDFIHYYGHKPDGMWLPETAVDLESMEVMAANGIQFTILAPWQADTDHLDTTKPYFVELSNNRRMTVFFYDADLSARVSFDPKLTVNADRFIPDALMPKFNQKSEVPQFVMIASDGELYGHHQAFRDKFLERLIHNAHYDSTIRISYPGLWLKEYDVVDEIKIRDKTSWSCHHGVNRWSSFCDCTPHAEWKQPLRHAMDQLGDLLDEIFVDYFSSYLANPFELRHRFIHVIHGSVRPEELLDALIAKPLSDEVKEQMILLLEAQYERQRMFTSCGWFFDDFDRIEPRNNLAYAAHACWLTRRATGIDLMEEAMELLQSVKSWRSGLSASTVFSHWINQEYAFMK